MTHHLFRAVFCALLIAAAAASLVAQAPPRGQTPPSFRVEVNYVEVDATVTDAQGRPVEDLTAADFELLEDRRPQAITAFSQVNIPVERLQRPLFAPAAIEPDVQANTGGDGRLYLIVLDSLHTSPLNTARTRAAARRFVEQYLASNDTAAVVFTGGPAKNTQDFTGNKRLLLAAIDTFSGMKPIGSAALAQDPLRDPLAFERASNVRNAMDRIRALAEHMANVRGRRKAMLLIGEGIDYPLEEILSNTSASGVFEDIRDAIGAATRANVVIYAIDPRGLTNVGTDAADAGTPLGVGPPEPGASSPGQAFLAAQQSLRMISEETGGFAVINQNDFAGGFDRIVRDNSSYYVLGYYSTNERRDGRFRSISVRVKRPGLVVRARRGYVAPRGRAPSTTAPADPLVAALDEAISSPLPVVGIPLRVFAAAYRGEAPNASVAVAVEMDVQRFRFTEADGAFNNRVEFALTATDAEGKQRASATHAVTLAFKPDTLERAKRSGFRLLSQLDVPPGRYQIRVAVAERGGSSGSVIDYVDVPDFSSRPMTMSGLSITSSAAAETPTVRPRDPLAQFLPGPATTAREFSAGDEIAIFAEFYENATNVPPHKVDISTTLRTDTGRIVFEDREERDSAELQGRAGGYGYTKAVPLRGLQPGSYVLHVEGVRATPPSKREWGAMCRS